METKGPFGLGTHQRKAYCQRGGQHCGQEGARKGFIETTRLGVALDRLIMVRLPLSFLSCVPLSRGAANVGVWALLAALAHAGCYSGLYLKENGVSFHSVSTRELP